MASEQRDRTLLEWTPIQLLARCRDSRPDNSHERFCFELFRRAIVEKSEQCWATIYQQYQNLVYHWTLDFAQTNHVIDDLVVEELVVEAFTSFWRAYTAEKLSQANGIGSILSYLKSCAATAVLQARRKVRKESIETSWNDLAVDAQPLANTGPMANPGPGVEQLIVNQVSAEQLWAIVDSCCHDEKERIIARLSFVSDLKPNLILEHNRDLFVDVAEIYTIRRNLKNRLWRNEQLRILGGETRP
ncbi:MAG: sigma-70 family RNA polymerase sigma factor [Caldilineaceae bacterium]|nr:sigma-70 family RNA polymerase sigma factor [Caldilineaceae bacterium]